MAGHMHLRLPSGTVNTFSLPLTSHIAKQVAAGTLEPVEDTPSPDVLDGGGDAERVSASPPVAIEQTAPVNPGEPVEGAEELPAPAGNATQQDWAAYAVQQGMHPDEAAGLKREEIKARIAPADDTGTDDTSASDGE